MATKPRVTDLVNPNNMPTIKPVKVRLVNRITILLDESGSMHHLRASVLRYANEQIANIKRVAAETGQATYITLLAFDTKVRVIFADAYCQSAPLVSEFDYNPNGGTALADAIRFAIDNMPEARDGQDDASHLIITLTDGQENASHGSKRIGEAIARAQGLGNWTFAFLGPYGCKQVLSSFGVPVGNITEWEQTVKGVETASVITRDAVSSYYDGRSRGERATSTLFTDLSAVRQADLKKMDSVTGNFNVWMVNREIDIKSFVEGHGHPYIVGRGYYELTKPERVQAHKRLVIRDKNTGKLYGGDEARRLLGIATGAGVSVKVAPGNHANYNLFVLSTSTNRKLVRGTLFLYEK